MDYFNRSVIEGDDGEDDMF